MERRRLLAAATAAALQPLVGCGGGAMSAAGTAAEGLPDAGPAAGRELPILPLDDGVRDAAGVREFSLRVQRGSAQLLDGVTSATLGYNGPVLGPALRVRSGEPTRIRVRNDLDEPTSVHWHGLTVPSQFDGGPHQPIAAGAAWEAAFTIANPPSTCWFHPHLHGATGRQVVLGLAGVLVVEPPAGGNALLPSAWGVDDLALVLQDKRISADGRIDYTLSAADAFNGYTGERLLANGVAGASWRAPAQWVRLRLVNACNARGLRLELSDALPMLQIANEGGYLASPVQRASITLWPGERAEVLADLGRLGQGRTVTLLAGSPGGGLAGGGAVPALSIRVDRPRRSDAIAAAPAALTAAPAVAAGPAATLRTFGLDGGMMGRHFTINGRSFDPARIDFVVPTDAVEVWRFTNRTAVPHPMHVHGVAMSVRSQTAAAAHERGLRDTFVVEPMQVLDVAVRTPSARTEVPLVLHCHNLEHEDAGMMAQFMAA